MRKHLYLVSILLGMGVLSGIDANAQQKIGNNPGSLNPGAVLELESTNRGFLLPRISLTSLSTWGLNGAATDGMMVFNTNATTGAGYYVWSGGAWNRIFTGTIDAATTNALAYNATTRILTSTVNGVAASTTALPLAASGATGLLSNTDWATFNAKQNALAVSNGLTLAGSALTLGGNLTAATTLTLGTNALTFNASGTGQVSIQGPTGNTAGLRLSNLTGAGTAGTAGQKVLSVNASGDVVLVTDFGSNNAGTVTNVTGTAPITVTNGTTAPVIGINQSALDLALMGGILPVTKLAAGTTGQTLQMVGTTPTWVTPSVTNTSNIYTADGTLSGNRTVSLATNRLQFSGTANTSTVSIMQITNQASTTGGFLNILDMMTPNMPLATSNMVRQGRAATTGNSAEMVFNYVADNSPLNSYGIGFFGTPSRLLIQSDGNVGIGTMTPSQRLHVAGGALISSLAGTGSRMVVADAAGVLSTQAIPPISSVTNGNGLTLTSGVLAFTPTANSIPATSITGLDVTAGSNKVTLGGTPAGAALKAFSVDVNEANLSLAAIGGTLPVAKISPAGTAGQVLTSTGGTTAPTWSTLPVTSNIYTADGGLNGARTVTLAGNNLTFNASSTGQVIVQGPTGNTAGLRLSNLTGAGTAGTSGQKVLSVNASGDVVLVTDFGTANAGTVTNVTGSGLIAVANGSTTPAVSLVPGTTGQVLQMVGTTPTWVTPSAATTQNIYTANGTLTADRVVTQGINSLTFTGGGQLNKFSGSASNPATFYLGRTTTEAEFGVASAANQGLLGVNVGDVWLKTNLASSNLFIGTSAAANTSLLTNNTERVTVTSTGLVGIGTNAPTSTLDVNGSVSRKIDGIVQTAANIAAASRTLNATHHVVTIDAETAPASPNNFIEVILPNPSTCSGREYVIRKIDNTSNEIRFSYPVNGAIPAVTAGGNAILVSKGSFTGVLNYVRTLRIISNGTNWLLID